jgi:hypothetical protein
VSTAGAEVRAAALPPPSRSEQLRPAGEETVEDERQIYIVKVDPNDVEGEKEQLAKDALSNLSALFEKLREKGLPNGLYRIYFKEPGFPRRLVIEFYKWGDTFGEPVQEPGRGSMPIPDQPPQKPQEDGSAKALPALEEADAGWTLWTPPEDAPASPTTARDAADPRLEKDDAGVGLPDVPSESAEAAEGESLPYPTEPAGAATPALVGAGALTVGMAAHSAQSRWEEDVDKAMENSQGGSFTKAARLRRRLRR